jgi:2-oxoglutarate ferredoxin oxidoreductase subunit beta
MATADAFKSDIRPDWCPGCGDFGVLNALKTALGSLQIDPKDVLICSGIGCSSNLPGFIHAYGFHGLHGRAVPVATGAKLANPELHVIVTGGDGDGYGIGIGHFLHAMRRNINITYIVMNNAVYGLTTGQVSPTTQKGIKTKTTPMGNPELPINPVALALVAGATFVSRGFSANQQHLADVMARAIRHRGFALVDVFSPCVTYDPLKVGVFDWFKQRVYTLEEAGHDAADLTQAMEKALEWGERLPIGVFYEVEGDTLEDFEPALAMGPPVQQELGLTREEGAKILGDFM